jgi:hypothetical protein
MMADQSRHTTVFMWMHRLIIECEREGILGPQVAVMLNENCADIRSYANDLNNYLYQEIPYPYAQVRRNFSLLRGRRFSD